ncbi:hydroxyethylthiazole kinase [Campylobacter majalis]|uniref:hydroxyethylthiazole kinase n=1 Tax=Campylobacter majalis TaxID=2790656 RepID=UPI003D68DA13
MISKIKEKNPLIHNITNYVTVNGVANALISLGASPVMADSEFEVSDIVSISNALVINIGTLNERVLKSMIKAGIRANELGLPVVLDPVGAGASLYRTQAVFELLKSIKFSLIRLNISEAKTLINQTSTTKGVDASQSDLSADLSSAISVAKNISEKFSTITVISGKSDIITNGKNIAICDNGHEMMSKITGSGCMLSAVLGAFMCVGDTFETAVHGVSAYGICGERAFDKLGDNGNATYATLLIDELAFVSDDDVVKFGKIRHV